MLRDSSGKRYRLVEGEGTDKDALLRQFAQELKAAEGQGASVVSHIAIKDCVAAAKQIEAGENISPSQSAVFLTAGLIQAILSAFPSVVSARRTKRGGFTCYSIGLPGRWGDGDEKIAHYIVVPSTPLRPDTFGHVGRVSSPPPKRRRPHA